MNRLRAKRHQVNNRLHIVQGLPGPFPTTND
jgi:sensor histidine kinase regulating citrate/malate metabolism